MDGTEMSRGAKSIRTCELGLQKIFGNLCPHLIFTSSLEILSQYLQYFAIHFYIHCMILLGFKQIFVVNRALSQNTQKRFPEIKIIFPPLGEWLVIWTWQFINYIKFVSKCILVLQAMIKKFQRRITYYKYTIKVRLRKINCPRSGKNIM